MCALSSSVWPQSLAPTNPMHRPRAASCFKTFALCHVAPTSFLLIIFSINVLIILCRSDEEESCDETLTPKEASTIFWSQLLSESTTALRVWRSGEKLCLPQPSAGGDRADPCKQPITGHPGTSPEQRNSNPAGREWKVKEDVAKHLQVDTLDPLCQELLVVITMVVVKDLSNLNGKSLIKNYSIKKIVFKHFICRFFQGQ